MWLPLLHPLLGIWPTTLACALTENQTSDPVVHRPELNPLSYTSQGPFLPFKCGYWKTEMTYVTHRHFLTTLSSITNLLGVFPCVLSRFWPEKRRETCVTSYFSWKALTGLEVLLISLLPAHLCICILNGDGGIC